MALTTAMANALASCGSVTTSATGSSPSYTSGSGSLVSAGSGITVGASGSSGSIWLGSGTGASSGSVIRSTGATSVWTNPSMSSTQISMVTSSGEQVIITADILNRLTMLIDVILELPDTHALADLKRDLLVKESMQILGKPDESIR